MKIRMQAGLLTGAFLAFPEDKKRFLTRIMIRIFKAKFTKAMKDRQKEIDILNNAKQYIDWTLVWKGAPFLYES